MKMDHINQLVSTLEASLSYYQRLLPARPKCV